MSGLDRFVQWALGVLISTGLVLFVARSLVSRWFKRDLAVHKEKLRANTEIELERLRLRAAVHRHRFTSLHDRRARIIAKLYRLLVEAEDRTARFLSPIQTGAEPSRGELAKDAAAAGNSFSEFFWENRIFLDEALCTQIEGILDKLKRLHFVGATAITDPDVPLSERLEAFKEVRQGQIPALRAALETRFRRLLGVEEAEPSNTEDGEVRQST